MSIAEYDYLQGFYLIIAIMLLLLLIVIGMSIKTNTEKIIRYLEIKSTEKKGINSLLIKKLLKDSNLDIQLTFPRNEDKLMILISKKFRITSPDEFDWEITVSSIKKDVIFREIHPNIDESDMNTILNRVYQLNKKYNTMQS